MPAISPDTLAVVEPYMNLAEKMGSLAAQMAERGFDTLELAYGGTVSDMDTRAVTISAIKGLLGSILGIENVNFVNAQSLLKDRGVKLLESKTESAEGYSNTITLKLRADGEVTTVQGTVYSHKDRRIVELNGYRTYVPSEGNVVVAVIEDKPKIIGPCCVVLGEDKINIGSMHVGRSAAGQPQLMILSVDQEVPEATLQRIRKVPGVISAKTVTL
jgi:D-3-phosphoglycerate dehydrogenase